MANQTDPSGRNPRSKPRKPLLAAFLSFLSTGLGQVYNGEIIRGLALKTGLCLAFGLYALSNFISMNDLFYLIVFLAVFAGLKTYSAVQAFLQARRKEAFYALRSYNRVYIYTGLTILFLFLNILAYLAVANSSLMRMTPYHPYRSAKAKARYLDLYEKRAEFWPVDSVTRSVETSFGLTFVRISGPEEAPPLVLLPGASATSLLWIPNINAFSKSYRTYALDNIYDFGKSVFTRKITSPDDFVLWLDELFTALKLGDDINLLGLSYGGWLTSQYALRHPDRLAKIVLLSPAATVAPFNPEFLKRAALVLLPHRRYIRNTLQWVMEDLTETDEAGPAFLKDYVDDLFISIRCFKPKMLVSPTVLTDEELKSLDMPTLLIVSENEKVISVPEALERLGNIAPSIETVVISGAGHDLSVLKADQVNSTILEFLGRR